MKLSNNLSLGEFTHSQTAKRRGIDNTPSPEHLKAAKALAENIFQPIRRHFAVPIYLSSGYRSAALNEAIGGSKTSQHSKGEAIDIDMDFRKGPKNYDVFQFIKEFLDFDQLIWEFGTKDNPDWVHVSYNSDGEQRGQILVAKRNSKGKTYYETWSE